MCHCEEEAISLVMEGNAHRAVAEHKLNRESTRSHCVLTLHVRQSRGERVLASKLHLVDLAGSERLKKTASTGTTQAEAVHINKSLTFLEQVVLALGKKETAHVPFRQSKLTHLLKACCGWRGFRG